MKYDEVFSKYHFLYTLFGSTTSPTHDLYYWPSVSILIQTDTSVEQRARNDVNDGSIAALVCLISTDM